MVVTPAIAHRASSRNCAPFLKTDRRCSSIRAPPAARSSSKRDCGPRRRTDVTVAESNSLIYACRSPAPAQAFILGIKKDLLVAAIPATQTGGARPAEPGLSPDKCGAQRA